ncbi:helicase-exonuclease AddAB subunit AddB [Alkalibacter rhizosphaerae]|uniref:Helicase-exonuclease AddAB subunit AddB n=1 Tax=Alkalibacter rhizosphaerae TaxID=2815577 RepID=A0A974XK88_9FIRM|nr:helicase-exonuclease AddAB subunit AddB [Alkalibacter rhizosphaerae]QSX07516.1 helicase-exonuclease AddAB subunit AddB [Alkalibacter rhizosphaerae]
MLKILAGRNDSGKTKEMYRQIKDALQGGEENLIVLVPEQYTLEAEKELMEVLELQGFFQLEVMGFNRLVDDLLDTALEREKTIVTATGKRMILKRILKEEKKELQVFGSMIDKSGFIEEVENVLQNFKENMVEPEGLRGFARGYEGTGMLEKKVGDMVRIYEAYQRYLEKGYTDNEHRIAEGIEAVSQSLRIKGSRIWIHGFHTFTKQLVHFIKALSDHAQGVVLTLDLDVDDDAPDKEVFGINRKTLQTFRELWADELEVELFSSQRSSKKDLDHLKQEFFAYPYGKWTEEVDGIRVLESQNVYREIDHAVKEIAVLAREKGWSYKDMGVVVNDLSSYGFAIQRTMEEYGIPCFLDAKRSMADKPLGLFVVSSLQVLVRNYRYEDVFSMLKTGFSNLEEGEWESLENYCLQFGIRGSQWKTPFHKCNNKTLLPLEELDLLREKVVEPLERLRSRVRQAPTFASIAKALYGYLEENRVVEKTQALTAALQQHGDLEHGAENNQVFNRIMELLDELVEVFGEEKTTLREFAEILKEGVAASELGVLPASGDEVLIGDVKRSRQGSLAALFILGVNEGILPGEGETIGIFTTREGKVLEDGGIPLFQDHTYQAIQEKYLFQTLLSKGEERIYFSCAQADFEGSAMRPSFYMKRLKELFPRLESGRDEEDALDWITNARGTLRPMVAHFRHAMDQGGKGDPVWEETYRWYASQEEWKDRLDQLTGAMTYANKVDKLDRDQVEGLYGKTIKNSVTSLETYGQCPFRYFVRYGLHPAQRPVYEVSIPDMGELLHDSLQEYTRRLQGEGTPWEDVEEEARIGMCGAIVEEKIQMYKEGVFASKGRYQYLAYYLNRLMIRAVNTLTYHMSKGAFRLEKAEAAFGEDREYSPVVFTYDEDIRMVLEGRIDRMDVLRQDDGVYVKIIDYKTGEKTLELKDVYYGLTLQLLMYLQVCLESIPQAMPAGAFYFKLDDPMIQAYSHEREEMDRKITSRLRLLGLLVKKMEVVTAMDKGLEEDTGDSDVVRLKIKKDGDFGKSSKGLVEAAVFDRLLEHTMDVARKMGKEIIQGNIAVSPVKNDGKPACRFCPYKTICQFDDQFEGNRYRIRGKLKDEEVVNRLMGGRSDE